MEPASWIELGAAAACLLLVALTAATEVVLAPISRHQLRQHAEREGRIVRSVAQLLARPRAHAAALILLRTIGATVFTLLIASIFITEQLPLALLLTAVAVVPLLLLVGHTLPRALASRSIEATATNLAPFAILATALASPLLLVADLLTRLGLWIMRRSVPQSEQPEPLIEEELQAVLGTEYAAGDPIEEEERQMIDAILELDDRTARDIMVPRLDVVAVPLDLPLPDVIALIRKAGHSRMPVYRGSIDEIVGIIHAKDLLRLIGNGTAPVPLIELLRPLDMVVPESKQIAVLLREMRTRRQHLALVADEYGGTAGIVTIEDILEEIVGEIDDEHDEASVPVIQEVSADELLVEGRTGADEVSDWLHLPWSDDEEHTTVSGLVQRELGRLPEIGESVDYGGARITVLEVEGHRLKRLRVERLPGPSLSSNTPENGTEVAK